MKNTLSVVLVASLFLAGCNSWSNSRANPRNWFGSSQPSTVAPPENASTSNPLMAGTKKNSIFSRPTPDDNSVPIAKVTELRIEPTPSGAIIYAEGVATRQGPFNTDLRLVTTEEEAAQGVMAFSFRVLYPVDPTPIGTELSRTVHEAYSISRQGLSGVKLIRVSGRENALESRRR